MKKLSLLFTLLITLVACSAEEKPKKPEGVLTDSQTKALEQAKAVDDTLQKAEEERRKQLEDAEK